MPVLQRSCLACASAKRQCDLAVPQCARCSSRRIECEYINQPGAVPFSLPVANYRSSDGRTAALEKSSCSYRSTISCRLPIYNPLRQEVIRTFGRETIQQQMSILQSFSVQYAQCGSNAFIHPCLYESRSPPPLLDVSCMISASCKLEAERLPIPLSQTFKPKVRHLLYSGARASSYTELVSCIQAIVLLQIARLFHDDREDDSEHENRAIWALTSRLWQHAPTQLPSSLSPWQAWVFAESVRRTLLVCNILLSVCGALRRGYAVHAVCIEALPFDMRTQLWDANSEDSWKAAAANCTAPLVSFRQFKSLREPTNDSPFESLLRLSFKDVGCDGSGSPCSSA
ncbi:hypothetical protein F5B17DRAFT_444731 [Nemania serpens]|nr:hypothetical protein F5B17DRAFT_444731 [Nemania serpens]